MAKKVKVVLNREGVRELLRSEAIMAACQEAADRVREAAGPAYRTSAHVGKNRVNVSVYTEDEKAIQDNLDGNTLLKSLHK